MTPTESAETALAPHADELVGVVRGAWDDYAAEGRPRKNPTTRAMIVCEYMHERAIQFDGLHPARSPRAATPFYRLDDLSIRFKYLRGGVPANIRTHAQMAVAQQIGIPFKAFPREESIQLQLDGLEDEVVVEPAPPYVTVGYELDPTGSEVDSVVALCQHNGSTLWCVNLDLLAAVDTIEDEVVEPIEPHSPHVPDLPEIAVASERPKESEAPIRIDGDVRSEIHAPAESAETTAAE